MSEDDAARAVLATAAEGLREDVRFLIPRVRQFLGPVVDWDAEQLVSREWIFRAHCRDCVIRLVGVSARPAEADRLTWWRAAADEADDHIARFVDLVELAKLLLFTGDDLAIRYLLIHILTVGVLQQEHRRRLQRTRIGQAFDRLFNDPEAAGSPPVGALRPLLAALHLGGRISRRHHDSEDKQSEALAAFWRLYSSLEEEAAAAKARGVDPGYRMLALSPMRAMRPTDSPEWETVAGELLVEDISAGRQDLSPLLAPHLDERAHDAARDALREEERRQAAQERGGPGASWTCGCGISHPWTSPACATCGRQQPPGPEHVPLSEQEADTSPSTAEALATQTKFLDSIRARWGNSRSYQAFLAYFEGQSVTQAAASQAIDESTLREFINNIRKVYKHNL